MAAGPQDAQKTLILWIGFLASHLLMVAVAWVARTPGPLGDTLGPPLLGAAAAAALTGGIVAPRLLSGRIDAGALFIVRLAMVESATLVGLVLALLGAAVQWFAPAQILGLVLHLLLLPRSPQQS